MAQKAKLATKAKDPKRKRSEHSPKKKRQRKSPATTASFADETLPFDDPPGPATSSGDAVSGGGDRAPQEEVAGPLDAIPWARGPLARPPPG